MKDSGKIAVFDSGMGGITVLGELFKLMPEENYIYFGDSKNAPYGTKETSLISELTLRNFNEISKLGIKAFVIACNTATAAAATTLRNLNPNLPIIGLEPALKPACEAFFGGTVCVLATELTLREEKFRLLMRRFENSAKIICIPAPKIVEMVEKGMMKSEEMFLYIKSLFAPFKNEKIDAVVLGCTHFPFVKDVIKRVLGDVALFDGAEGAARQTKRLLISNGVKTDEKNAGGITFENSDQSHIELEKNLFEYYIKNV